MNKIIKQTKYVFGKFVIVLQNLKTTSKDSPVSIFVIIEYTST